MIGTSNKITPHSTRETLDFTDLSPENDLRVLGLRDLLDLHISRREKEKEERERRKERREGGRKEEGERRHRSFVQMIKLNSKKWK